MIKNVQSKINLTKKTISFLRKTSTSPNEINTILEKKSSSKIKQKMKIDKVLSRPKLSIEDFIETNIPLKKFILENEITQGVLEQAEIEVKYMGYISRERDVAEKISRLEKVKIPLDIDYKKFSSLSNESKEKLSSVRPTSLGQASRISGIKPSDISVLMVYLGR